MNLQEIQEMANKGYIDDLGEVEEVIRGILGITMEDLLDSVRGFYRTFFEALLDHYGIRYEHMSVLTWLDLICMIGNLHRGSEHAIRESDRLISNYRKVCARDLMQLIVEAGKNNYDIKLFLALNMHAFFEYMGKIHNDRSVSGLYDRICGFAAWQDEAISDKVNSGEICIGEYLKTLSAMEQMPWRPWKSLDEYKHKMLRTNDTEDIIVVRSFYITYKEFMDIDDLMARIEALDESFFDDVDEEMKRMLEEMEEETNGKHN